MATARQTRAPPQRRRWRWVWRSGLAVIVLGGALLGWLWPSIDAYATAGAAYDARIGCSCRFVAGRSLADCRGDLEPGMDLVKLSEDPTARSMTARTALLWSQTARWRPGWGCQLDAWDGA